MDLKKLTCSQFNKKAMFIAAAAAIAAVMLIAHISKKKARESLEDKAIKQAITIELHGADMIRIERLD